MKTATKYWNGKELRETIIYNTRLFRIVTGLYNGGSQDDVHIWTSQSGWEFVIGKHDIGIPTMFKETSYVSNEPERKQYAEELNKLLKDNITKLF